MRTPKLPIFATVLVLLAVGAGIAMLIIGAVVFFNLLKGLGQ